MTTSRLGAYSFISTSILFPIWMISMSIITIWSIVTGFIFLKKD